MPDKIYLKQMQRLPLIVKIRKTQLRIREWYEHFDGRVHVSFSGGKDSTALAHLVHEIYPDVPLVFINTGLEYPEIQSFARNMGAEFVRPKMRFDKVISKFGYPIISKEVSSAIYYARRIKNTEQGNSGWEESLCGKRNQLLGGMTTIKNEETNTKTIIRTRTELNGERVVKNGNETVSSIYNKDKWLPLCTETQFMISRKCCDQMKKAPIRAYQKKSGRVPFIGTLAEESLLREQAWVKHGCNAFDSKKQTSQPMSFWTEQDVLKYLYTEGWEIASVYGDIVGVDVDGMEYQPLPGVDCQLKCTGCQRTGCIFCGFGCHLDKGESRFQRLARTHPRQYEYCMEGGAVGR